MGRRGNSVVVLSSDDEDDEDYKTNTNTNKSNRSYVKRKSKLTVTRSNPRPTKKPRVTASAPPSRAYKQQSSCVDEDVSGITNVGNGSICLASDAIEIRLSFEDFDNDCNGFKVSAAGSARRNTNESGLWIDKYKPMSFEELAVHKKKVEEVKAWFAERLRMPKDEPANRVLVISGPAGVGKSATIHVIASHLGASICEWNTPIPTVWQEHVHNSKTGVQYMSKLDEFEYFLEKRRKYGFLSTTFPEGFKSSDILVIDDLPLTNGRAAFERLRNCLLLLVKSVRIPTAVVLTDYGKSDTGDLPTRYVEELQSSLEDAGACKLFCLKLDSVLNISMASPSQGNGFSLQCGKDETLTLFHGLGKFLHNKRETENAMIIDNEAFLVRDDLRRFPIKMDAPEKILCQAHGQARPIADFLHENVMEFISEEAIDDAWAVASYLGDSDLLLASSQGFLGRFYDAENVLQSAAASVAARGVLFGNCHPLPSRWHAIRSPKLWHVERSSLRNKNEMLNQRFASIHASSFSDLSVIATEYSPTLKWLGYRESENLEADPVSTNEIDGEQENEMYDDEIEDC
ncbi:hypothetical protein ACFE04_000576 [Oxalis oulophora]